MPPVIVALAAAAGFFAAVRVISAMIGDNQPPEQMQAGDQPKQATAADAARDLGKLEFDSQSGVYRPKT